VEHRGGSLWFRTMPSLAHYTHQDGGSHLQIVALQRVA
jgi:hypothetical protein